MGQKRPKSSSKWYNSYSGGSSVTAFALRPMMLGADMVNATEIPIDNTATAMEMAEAIFGEGVTVVGASYTGDNRSSGIYSDGDSIAPGVTPSDTGVILSTGRTSAFTNSNGQSNHNSNTTTGSSGPNNEAGFNALAGANTYDASFLDVDFIATGDTMTMQFVFSSEEYPEYASSIYNDVVGVWVNGVNVPIEIGSGTTSVLNVNHNNNFNLYNDNTSDQYNTEMDGFTVTMTLTIPVTAGEVTSLRIGIADVSDSSYDSNLLIAGDSVQTALVAESDSVSMFANGSRVLDVTANDSNSSAGVITVTHINGQAVVAGDTITLATGQQVTLNADGTFTIVADNDIETVNFTYGIENAAGVTDTGYVTVDTIPCFVTGTGILTPKGEVAVEDLKPGDLVMTHDNGPQPVRWVGRRVVDATGKMAPVCIAKDTFGNHAALMLSPLHRVLISDIQAELLFGETEVLIAARDLVDGENITIKQGGTVEYVHILFDAHQVVYSGGLATESFLPGPQMAHSFEAEIVEEICTIFPEIDPDTGHGYSPAARRTLRGYEAQLLMNPELAA